MFTKLALLSALALTGLATLTAASPVRVSVSAAPGPPAAVAVAEASLGSHSLASQANDLWDESHVNDLMDAFCSDPRARLTRLCRQRAHSELPATAAAALGPRQLGGIDELPVGGVSNGLLGGILGKPPRGTDPTIPPTGTGIIPAPPGLPSPSVPPSLVFPPFPPSLPMLPLPKAKREGEPKKPAAGGTNQCNTGTLKCCNHVVSQDSEAGRGLLAGALSGLSSGNAGSGDLGFECDVVDVLAGSLSETCKATPVCCENESSGGLVNFGCVPVVL